MLPTQPVDFWSNAASQVHVPVTGEKIFKDECSFFFDTAEFSDGVYICMKHFIAIGSKAIKRYVEATNSHVFLNHRIKRSIKDQTTSQQRPSRLAIGLPGGFELPQDRYTVSEIWTLVFFPDNRRIDLSLPSEAPSPTVVSHLSSIGLPDTLALAVSSVVRFESAILAEERARNVAAWEDENLRPVSLHSANLLQLDNGVRVSPTGWKCSQCELRENLWLNLTDGSINCGRRFWDGSGGNNHALEHYDRTSYPLAVKLGTITPEGAEVFSYPEDELVTDPLLAEHLAHFGIDIMRMEKTDKTIAELEVSANERLGEWRILQESDRELQPRYGPGMTGLRNLGNTCYMNSVLQILFAIPDFRRLYAYRLPHWIDLALSDLNASNGASLPVDNISLQFAKIGYGLCSGAYSWPHPVDANGLPSEGVPLSPGIRPLLFRRLVAQRNKTFSTNRQQDACEFLSFLLDLLDSDATQRRKHANHDSDREGLVSLPSSCFHLSVEDRLECGLTNKVRYDVRDEYVLTLPVPMESMLNKVEFEAYENCQAGSLPRKQEDIVRPKIPFESCLSAWCMTERVEDFITPASDPPGARTFALRQSRLLNFPDYLCVQLAKYIVGSDWLPRKLDCEIEFQPSGDGSCFRIDLSRLRCAGGLRPNEELMPDSPSTICTQSGFMPDPKIMSDLINMGFTNAACVKACTATNNGGLEAAASWIMEHLDDPSLNEPLASNVVHTVCQPIPDQGSLEMLKSIGLTTSQALEALKKNNNDLEKAANWAFANLDALTSLDEVQEFGVTNNQQTKSIPSLTDGCPLYELIGFISHMGKSTSHGHYVAHIRRSELAKGVPGESAEPVYSSKFSPCTGTGDEWIIFNDENVAKSETPPYRLAYLYVFRRMDLPRSD